MKTKIMNNKTFWKPLKRSQQVIFQVLKAKDSTKSLMKLLSQCITEILSERPVVDVKKLLQSKGANLGLNESIKTEEYSIMKKRQSEGPRRRWSTLTGEPTSLPLLNTVDGMELSQEVETEPNELAEYGLIVKDKETQTATMLWIRRTLSNQTLNKYLIGLYESLIELRDTKNYIGMWKLYFFLIQQSDAFFIASLSS
jgi:hypothetical protein